MAVTVLSLGFLYVKDREVYRTALRSEMVKVLSRPCPNTYALGSSFSLVWLTLVTGRRLLL
jgi:hypothetical protein